MTFTWLTHSDKQYCGTHLATYAACGGGDYDSWCGGFLQKYFVPASMTLGTLHSQLQLVMISGTSWLLV